ncbi:MAG: MerR family transcriptional regulator [Anaerolineae bacterium]|nr:MerR family transcriptional regulator [Anaerolineae bacterium]
MFKIGDFSRLCRVPVSTLRYYADIGLLEPAHIDPESGYRFYSLDQLTRLNQIVALRDLGFALDQIGELIDENLTIDQIKGMLKLRRVEIEKDIREELARLERVENWLQQAEQNNRRLMSDIVLKRIEKRHALTLRVTLPELFDMVPIYTEAARALRSRRVPICGPCFAIYYDQEWTGKDIDMELVFEVDDSYGGDIDLESGLRLAVRQVEPVENAACLVRYGRYTDFTESYTLLATWIAQHGFEMAAGPNREIYIKPDEVVELQVPVAPVVSRKQDAVTGSDQSNEKVQEKSE